MQWEDLWRNRPYTVWTRRSEEEVRRLLEGNWQEGQLSWYSGWGWGKMFRGVRTVDGYVLGFLSTSYFANYNGGPYLRLRIEQWGEWTRVRVERHWMWRDSVLYVMPTAIACITLLAFGQFLGLGLVVLNFLMLGVVEGVVWEKMRNRLLVLLGGKEEA